MNRGQLSDMRATIDTLLQLVQAETGETPEVVMLSEWNGRYYVPVVKWEKDEQETKAVSNVHPRFVIGETP